MKIITAVVLGIIVVALGFLIFSKSQITNPAPEHLPDTSPSTIPQEKVGIKAYFKIITSGQIRIFTDSKYHNKSEDVYIGMPDPSVVKVTKTGITWDDFFKTLPIKLSKDCLTTGTGQLFCTGDKGTLKFYLNDVEDKDLLDREIKDGDKILIEFK